TFLFGVRSMMEFIIFKMGLFSERVLFLLFSFFSFEFLFFLDFFLEFFNLFSKFTYFCINENCILFSVLLLDLLFKLTMIIIFSSSFIFLMASAWLIASTVPTL